MKLGIEDKVKKDLDNHSVRYNHFKDYYNKMREKPSFR